MRTAEHVSRGLSYQPALDGIRAVAVTGVLLFHAFAASGFTGWVRGGSLGVSVFFTLSGFLITTLLLTEVTSTGRIDVGRFLTRRVQRLAPAATVVTAGVMVLHALDLLSTRGVDVVAALWSATNWHIIHGGDGELLATVLGPFGPTWSLAVEEQAYLVLAALAWSSSRITRPHLVLGTGVAVAVVAAVVSAITAGDWSPRVEFGTDTRAGEIAIGVALALLIDRRPHLLERHRGLLSIGGAAGATALVALFLVADYSPPWLLHGGFLAVALCSALVIAAAVAETPLRQVLSVKPLVSAGKMSYALYLVHWPIYLVLSVERTGTSGATLVAIRLAATVIAAAGLHVGVEQPLRRRPVSPAVAIGTWLASSIALSALAITSIG